MPFEWESKRQSTYIIEGSAKLECMCVWGVGEEKLRLCGEIPRHPTLSMKHCTSCVALCQVYVYKTSENVQFLAKYFGDQMPGHEVTKQIEFDLCTCMMVQSKKIGYTIYFLNLAKLYVYLNIPLFFLTSISELQCKV